MGSNSRRPDRWLAAATGLGALGILSALGLTGPRAADAPDPVLVDAQAAPFEFYRRNIEPIFARPRGYPNDGDRPACVMCHVWQTSVRFDLQDMTELPDGWGWTEEQSRRNYAMMAQLVDASNPATSKLLRKPLATDAGGEPHTGGTFWESTSDPEYQTVLEWIEMLPEAQFTPAAAPQLDFEFYRACVQRVFATPKPGHLPCTQCHSGGLAGFAPRAANGTAWTEDEARRGFTAIQRLIVPGNPTQSRWLLKPLHPDGGGSYTHNGVRRWQSRDDPEWQMLAAWVRGERRGTNCSPLAQ